MKEVMYNKYAKEALEALSKGAFLNVRSAQEDNTMTIAWGSIGFMWGKPIFMVMVRYSRHTYQLIEQADCFTVSIPLQGQLKKELGHCGSQSGRDCNKWQELNLSKLEAHQVNAPLVGECDLHYECKIISKQEVTTSSVTSDMVTTFYNTNDYHVLYYGEIVGTYLK